MSILNNKQFLIPSSGNELLLNLKGELEEHGAAVTTLAAKDISAPEIEKKDLDVLILDFVSEYTSATKLLGELQLSDQTRTLIVLALVPDHDDEITSEVLSLGAADFILDTEAAEAALRKIMTLLGDPDKFSGSTMIDITPTEIHTKKSGISVYVVEDDSLLRNLLTTKLEQSNFLFHFSIDGKDVCSEVKQLKPNIIVLDIMLPGISGLEILRELKQDVETSGIPVIIFSNRDEQQDRQEAEELGAAGFYVKAMTDLSDLIKVLEVKAL